LLSTIHSLRHNYLGILFWTILAICFLGTAALVFFATSPQAVGTLQEVRLGQEAFAFHRFEFVNDYLEIRISGDPEPALLFPVYNGSDVFGAVLLGPGSYTFRPPQEIRQEVQRDFGRGAITDRLSAVFIPGSYQEIEEMRYRLEATPVQPTAEVLEEAKAFLHDIKPLGPNIEAFGLHRLLFYRPIYFFLDMRGEGLGTVHYEEGRAISLTFVDLGGKTVRFANPQARLAEELLYPVPEQALVPASVAVFGVMAVFLVLLVFALTIDLPRRGVWDVRDCRGMGRFVLFALTLIALEGVVRYYTYSREYEGPWLLYLHLFFGGLIGWYVWRSGGRPRDVGLTTLNSFRGLLVGALVGIIAVFSLTLSYPREVLVDDPASLALRFLGSFFLTSLFKTLYQQGFVQVIFQRILGPVPGLLITPPLFGVLSVLPHLLLWQGELTPLLIEGLVVVPISTFLVGYLVWRTENLYAGVMMRAVLDFLPQVLRF